MATYFVRKDGNDTTGDGSTGTPYLTIIKAVSVCNLAGNDVINVGDGTYQENSGSGYWNMTRNFSGSLTINSESGIAANVIIQGASGTTYNVLFGSAVHNVTFNNVTFKMRANDLTMGAIRMSYGVGINFNGCVFTALTSGAAVRMAINIIPTGTNLIQDVNFTNCTINQDGADNCRGAVLTGLAGATLDDINFVNCTMTCTGTAYAFFNKGGTHVNITGGTYTTSAASAIPVIYGTDADSEALTSSGTIDGATITSTLSHACLIGAGCDGVIVQNCTINGGDLGLVFKQCANGVATNNNIREGTDGSLYFKAATGATATLNQIYNSVGGACIRLGAGTADKSGSCTVTNNTAKCAGTSQIFLWSDDTGDLGGCVVDYNVYDPKGSGKFGAVRADTSVLDLTELRTAWAGYGDGSNDSHSSLYAVGDGASVGDGADGLLLLFRHHR